MNYTLEFDDVRIFILGDIHGRMEYLKDFVKEKRKTIPSDIPIIILQCGDFGIWPDVIIPSFYNVFIYFTPGNHENWEILDEYENKGKFEIVENCFYMTRLSTLTINEHVFMFIGGADSIDKHFRTPYIDWFDQETFPAKLLYEMEYFHVDTVIAHDCPEYFVSDRWLKTHNLKSQNRLTLNEVYNLYTPKSWFFGHYHKFVGGIFQTCQWKTLNMVGGNQNNGPWHIEIEL